MTLLSCRWWLPLLLFVVIAPFTPWIDLSVASYFYEPDGFVPQRDPDHPVMTALYCFGELPGQIVGAVAILVALGSYVWPSWYRWRNPALVLALTFVIGAGVMINVVFKELWGRPRPKQLEMFGGTEAFRPFYRPQWKQPEKKDIKSFPSGHAAMGFLFLTVGLIGWYERRQGLYVGGMVFGMLLGVLLSYIRMAQGGHFLTDVLASALLMWLVGLLCARLVYGEVSSNV